MLLIVNSLMRGNGGYAQVDTSQAITAISSGNVNAVTVNDKDQSLDVTLKNAVGGHEKITTQYPADASARSSPCCRSRPPSRAAR